MTKRRFLKPVCRRVAVVVEEGLEKKGDDHAGSPGLSSRGGVSL